LALLLLRLSESQALSGGDITMGLPRVQEIFEARTPGGQAEMSEAEGKVLEITPERVIRIKPKAKNSKSKTKKTDILEYKIPPKMAIWVEPGELVEAGQQLCEGSLDLKQVFKLRGSEETQRYIVKEIQKIYVSQGALIHDKHIEIICRQMFSRIRIKDPGDSIFSNGDVVEVAKLAEENARLKKEKKEIAKGLAILLGISRVALTTDSFLSAASFQETSRVLIKASLEGREDRLRGLKENVVIGKLIPAGTGFRHGQEKQEKPKKIKRKS
jgi:DNA-directed RNA polymerase subunit beta'